ncbi:hypothetical protein [Verticiella sediminum]
MRQVGRRERIAELAAEPSVQPAVMIGIERGDSVLSAFVEGNHGARE